MANIIFYFILFGEIEDDNEHTCNKVCLEFRLKFQ